MTLKDIAQLRLKNQQITSTEFSDPIRMLEWFCAMQAQEYAPSKWSLGLRVKNVRDQEIETLFNDGKILRTHLLRPTWHFVSSNDIRWLLKLTAPTVQAINAYMFRKVGLDQKILNRCNNILERILQEKNFLTRDAINKVLNQNKIVTDGTRLGYIMMNAELKAIICSGPRVGKQFTYALLHERAKKKENPEEDEALERLTNKYFLSRGPATVKDFSAWSGLSVTTCKRGMKIVERGLHKETVEGMEYYFKSELDLPKKSPGEIYLLPIYDEYIMGYRNRSAMMLYKNSLKEKTTFQFDNMIIQGGQVVGTWRREINTDCIELKVQFFKAPDRNQKSQLMKAGTKFRKFTGQKINCELLSSGKAKKDSRMAKLLFTS